VPQDGWRAWREGARAIVGDAWRGIPLADDKMLALHESEQGSPLDEVLEMAAEAVMNKPKGKNISAPRRPRPVVQDATEEPAERPKRAHSVAVLMVSKRHHRKRIMAVLAHLGIETKRKPYHGWRTNPLPDDEVNRMVAAFQSGVPGALVLNSALGTTAQNGYWTDADTLPHTEREAIAYAHQHRVNLRPRHPLRRQ